MKKIILHTLILLSAFSYSQNWGEQILNEPVKGFGNSFGASVAIDGDYAVVGTPGTGDFTGSVHVFKKDNNGNWQHHQKLEDIVTKAADEYFGSAVAIQGDFIFVSSFRDRIDEVRYELIGGSVTVFKKDVNNVWNGVQKLRASDISLGDGFGFDIDVSGDYLAISARYEDDDVNGLNRVASAGSVYIFKKDNNNTTWSQQQKIIPNHRAINDNFGKSIEIEGDLLAVSSNSKTDEANANPINANGSVFIFKKNNAENWQQIQKVKMQNGFADSYFGLGDISMSGDYLAVSMEKAEKFEVDGTINGYIYILKKDNNDIFSEHQVLKGKKNIDEAFGYSLSLDNEALLISLPKSKINGKNNVGKCQLFVRDSNNQYQLAEEIIPSEQKENSYIGGGLIRGEYEAFNSLALDENQFIIGANETPHQIAGVERTWVGSAFISGNIANLLVLDYTWTGAISTDWNTAGNWDKNAVPTAEDNVIINDVANAPKINFNQSYTVNNLTNHDGITIKTNASLTVNGNLDQKAGIQIESFANGNGSFILKGNQLNPNPPNITYLRYIDGNEWHLIGSPIKNQDIDNLAGANQLAEGQGNNRGIGFYNNNNNPSWNYYQAGAAGTGNFIEGKGYAIQTTANAFLNFTGILKSDDLENYAIVENLNGWNLVGNPYPAYINGNTNADANNNFLTVNAANLDPAFASIYLWNPNTNSYEPFGNGDGAKYVSPGQGFFVKSKNGGGTIDIRKSMLSHQPGNLFLKNHQTEKIVLNANTKNNVSKTTIAFKNNMTKGLDITYDAALYSGDTNNLSVFTNLVEDYNNLPFAIQFLPKSNYENLIIPVGISSTKDEKISISIEENTLQNHQEIYLEDTLLNTFVKLSEKNNYTFDYKKSRDTNGRFYLHFNRNSLHTENISSSSIKIYKDKNAIIHINGINEGILDVFTIKGQKIITSKKINRRNNQIEVNNLSKGVYLFKVTSKGKAYTKKIIL